MKKVIRQFCRNLDKKSPATVTEELDALVRTYGTEWTAQELDKAGVLEIVTEKTSY